MIQIVFIAPNEVRPTLPLTFCTAFTLCLWNGSVHAVMANIYIQGKEEEGEEAVCLPSQLSGDSTFEQELQKTTNSHGAKIRSSLTLQDMR